MKLKKGLFMKLELIGLFIFLIWFVNKILDLVGIGYQEPTTLIISVFALCGLEGGILGWIKTSKDKKRSVENENRLETKIDKP